MYCFLKEKNNELEEKLKKSEEAKVLQEKLLLVVQGKCHKSWKEMLSVKQVMIRVQLIVSYYLDWFFYLLTTWNCNRNWNKVKKEICCWSSFFCLFNQNFKSWTVNRPCPSSYQKCQLLYRSWPKRKTAFGPLKKKRWERKWRYWASSVISKLKFIDPFNNNFFFSYCRESIN